MERIVIVFNVRGMFITPDKVSPKVRVQEEEESGDLRRIQEKVRGAVYQGWGPFLYEWNFYRASWMRLCEILSRLNSTRRRAQIEIKFALCMTNFIIREPTDEIPVIDAAITLNKYLSEDREETTRLRFDLDNCPYSYRQGRVTVIRDGTPFSPIQLSRSAGFSTLLHNIQCAYRVKNRQNIILVSPHNEGYRTVPRDVAYCRIPMLRSAALTTRPFIDFQNKLVDMVERRIRTHRATSAGGAHGAPETAPLLPERPKGPSRCSCCVLL